MDVDWGERRPGVTRRIYSINLLSNSRLTVTSGYAHSWSCATVYSLAYAREVTLSLNSALTISMAVITSYLFYLLNNPPPSLVISSLLSHHFTRGHSLCSTALMQLFVFRLKHFTFIYSVHCFFFLFYYFSEWPCQSTHQIRSLLLTPVNSSKCPWNKAQI